MEDSQPPSLFEMQADNTTQSHLGSISKWGKFISITGIVFVALLLLVIAATGQQVIDYISAVMSLDDKLAGILIAILVIIGGLFLAWLFYLLRACILIKQGLVSRDSERLADGFKALKIFFIISMVFSILFILGTVSSVVIS